MPTDATGTPWPHPGPRWSSTACVGRSASSVALPPRRHLPRPPPDRRPPLLLHRAPAAPPPDFRAPTPSTTPPFIPAEVAVVRNAPRPRHRPPFVPRPPTPSLHPRRALPPRVVQPAVAAGQLEQQPTPTHRSGSASPLLLESRGARDASTRAP